MNKEGKRKMAELKSYFDELDKYQFDAQGVLQPPPPKGSKRKRASAPKGQKSVSIKGTPQVKAIPKSKKAAKK